MKMIKILLLFCIFDFVIAGGIDENRADTGRVIDKTLDEQGVLKMFNLKISNYEKILKEKSTRETILNKDFDNKKDEIFKLRKEIIEIKKRIFAIKLKKNAKLQVVKKIEYSLKFIHKKDVGDGYNKAFKYFANGDVKKAHKELKIRELREESIDIARRKKRTSARWLLKANFYFFQNDIKSARYCIKNSINVLSTFSNNLFYGSILENQNIIKRAYKYYQRAERRAGSSYEKAVVLDNLGKINYQLNNIKKAEKQLRKSVFIFGKLIKINRSIYILDSANALSDLGNLYYNTNELNRAEKFYNQVLAIFRELNNEQPNRYRADLARILSNLGNLYDKLNQNQKAQAAYSDSLRIREELAAINPSHKPEVSNVLNNLGGLYYRLGDTDRAEKMYRKSFIIREELAAINPKAYNPDLAMAANNLGNLYNKVADYINAKKQYTIAEKIYRKLAKKIPKKYKYFYGVSLNNLSKTYEYLDENKKAEAYYQATLTIRRYLAKINPRRYSMDLAATKIAYGFFLKDDRGEIIIKDAIKTLKKYKKYHRGKKLLKIANNMLYEIKK